MGAKTKDRKVRILKQCGELKSAPNEMLPEGAKPGWKDRAVATFVLGTTVLF